MAQLMNVRLSRVDAQPWGLRLQGGKDFGTPLVVQKVSELFLFILLESVMLKFLFVHLFRNLFVARIILVLFGIQPMFNATRRTTITRQYNPTAYANCCDV